MKKQLLLFAAIILININSFSINFSGTYKIGTTGANYQAIAYAVLALKNGIITGDCIFEIQADYDMNNEAIPLTIPYFANNPNNYKITFRPATNVSSLIVEGSSSLNGAGGGIINFDGAKNILFDGRAGGTGSSIVWTIRNNSTGPTIMLYNDASYIDLDYLQIQGKSNSLTSGLIVMGNGKTAGNKFINLQYSNITNASGGYPLNILYSNNTTNGITNSDIKIQNNNISNFGIGNTSTTRGAITVTGTGNGSNWTIDNNSFYNQNNTTLGYAVYFAAGSNSASNSISGNYIGGQAPQCQGTAWSSQFLYGIYVNCGGNKNMKTAINNNYFQNMSILNTSITTSDTYNLYCINIISGYCDVNNNIIGHPSNSNGIIINMKSKNGILNTSFINSTSPNEMNFTNNFIGNISLTGTYYYGGNGIVATTGTNNVSNNTITNITLDKLSAAFNGIRCNNSGDGLLKNNIFSTINAGRFYALFGASTTNLIISDNIISNITCYSSASNISYGISAYSNNASSNCIIKNNIIHDFSFTGGSTSIMKCIEIQSGNTSVYNNTIYNITATGANFYGILSRATVPVQIYDNEISNLLLTGGKHVNNSNTIYVNVYGIDYVTGIVKRNKIHDIKANIYNGMMADNTWIAGIIKEQNSTNHLYDSISNNKIYNFTCNTKSPTYHFIIDGIQSNYNVDNAQYHIIDRNTIYGLYCNDSISNANIRGITNKAGSSICTNNMISLGLKADGNSISAPQYLCGIDVANVLTNIYYNNIYIGGSGVKSALIVNNTSAITIRGTANADIIYDNILINQRSNNGNTGSNNCITLTDTTKIKIDHNLYLTSSNANGGYIGNIGGTNFNNFISWQLYTNKDSNSKWGNPLYKNISTYPPDLHLINSSSPAAGMGIPIAGITTDYDGDARSATAPTVGADELSIATTYKISGIIAYDNTAKSPIKNTYLILINSENVKIDSVQTNASGYYEFNNKANGQYTLVPKMTIVWNGGNSTDALLINKYFVKLINITDPLLKKAADVNIDNSINATDGLLINKRFVKLTNSFKAGDWMWDDNAVIVNGLDVIKDIKMVCTGDVNASYVP